MDMVIVVLLVVNLLAVLGVGLAVLGALKRVGGGAGDATAALADLGPRLDRLSDRLNEVVRQSAVETQDRMGQAFDGFKSSVSRDLAAGRKESSDALAVLATTVSADLARGRKESAESLDRTTRTLEARFEKPRDDEVEFGLLDGAVAAEFLRTLKDLLEQPGAILL